MSDEIGDEPGHAELVADLKVLREKGLTRLRRLDLPALETAAYLSGELDQGAENKPAAIERLLVRSVKNLGDGTLGQAANYLFGLVQGTRGRSPTDLRREAAIIWGIKADSFRKEPEHTVVGEIAHQILDICRSSKRSKTTTSASAAPREAKTDNEDTPQGDTDRGLGSRVRPFARVTIPTPVPQRLQDVLRQAMRNKTLVPFVGPGVSSAVAGLPKWSELLESGIEYLTKHRRRLSLEDDDISLLETLGASGDSMTALSKLQKVLARHSRNHWDNDEYAGWLEAVFGAPSVHDTGLLYRINRLGPRIVVTTNYDLLLEEHVIPDGSSVTWERPQELRALLRGGNGVAHIHGRFDRPNTVILSDSDYQRVVNDRDALRVSQSLFECGVLLFLGVGPDGASDPHLARLLENFAALSASPSGEEYPHVLLHEGSIDPAVRASLRARGVETLQYGSAYYNLESFLASLAEADRVTVDLSDIERIARSITMARTFLDGIRLAALEIERWVFPGRRVRVGYAHRLENDTRPGVVALVETAVAPGDFPCRFHYPISVAGWAVAEGRPISWPLERSRMCDIERVTKLGRLAEVRALVNDEVGDRESPLRQYLDLDAIPQKFDGGLLAIDDLFQDWSNTANEILFTQFVSLPVPRIATLSNIAVSPGVGVFNIDTADDGPPMLTPETQKKLNIISDLVYALYCSKETIQ